MNEGLDLKVPPGDGPLMAWTWLRAIRVAAFHGLVVHEVVVDMPQSEIRVRGNLTTTRYKN